MRSRFSDGVVIVLLGLALFTAAVHALPAPPTMQVAAADPQPLGVHLAGQAFRPVRDAARG